MPIGLGWEHSSSGFGRKPSRSLVSLLLLSCQNSEEEDIFHFSFAGVARKLVVSSTPASPAPSLFSFVLMRGQHEPAGQL